MPIGRTASHDPIWSSSVVSSLGARIPNPAGMRHLSTAAFPVAQHWMPPTTRHRGRDREEE
jgi:hypothetical protein